VSPEAFDASSETHLSLLDLQVMNKIRQKAFQALNTQSILCWFPRSLSILPRHAVSCTSRLPSAWRPNGERGMKKSSTSKPRPKVPDYCDVEPRRDAQGRIIWPAPEADMEQAREFIREWYAKPSIEDSCTSVNTTGLVLRATRRPS
jgi:hypothetical protein